MSALHRRSICLFVRFGVSQILPAMGSLPRSGLPPRSLSRGLYLLSKSVSVFSSFSYFSVFGFVRAVYSCLTPISEAATSD